MGRHPKRSRYTQEDVDNLLEVQRSKAKRRAIECLRRCLDIHLIEDALVDETVTDVSAALGIEPSTASTTDESVDDTSKNASKGSNSIEHNEQCEVCEREGNLLCCDTCPLVFHLKCIRPKLTTVPKGAWSCAYCLLQNTTAGDRSISKQAIVSMHRLTRGYDSADSEHEPEGQALRLARTGECSITHLGRKFVTRETKHKQIQEINRYLSLEEALYSVQNNQQQGKKKSQHPKHSGDGLWCTYCLDDPNVQICAFCGCMACFGKHDSSLLVLCDECDESTHCYCLQPLQSAVPVADPWYCDSCSSASNGNSKLNDASDAAQEVLDKAAAAAAAEKSNSELLHAMPSVMAPRGRGRPPGSSSKRKDSLGDLSISTASPQPVVAMQTRRLNSRAMSLPQLDKHSRKSRAARSSSIGASSSRAAAAQYDEDAGEYSESDSELDGYAVPNKVAKKKKDEVVSVSDLLRHIEQASTRMLTEEDLCALEYQKSWASRQTLHMVLMALSHQQLVLTHLLQSNEPGFEFSEAHEGLFKDEDLDMGAEEMEIDDSGMLSNKLPGRPSNQSTPHFDLALLDSHDLQDDALGPAAYLPLLASSASPDDIFLGFKEDDFLASELDMESKP